MDKRNPDNDANAVEPADELPQALLAALKAESAPLPDITAKADRAVARFAAEMFGARRDRHAVTTRRAMALAASVLIAVSAALFLAVRPVDDALAVADIDRSGQIDIADVFALARRGPDASAAELDAFAAAVVALDFDRGAP